MPAKKNSAQKQSFEEKMARLQSLVERLENPDIPLEESVALYKEGQELIKLCRQQLENAANEVRLLNEDGSLSPFAQDDDPPQRPLGNGGDEYDVPF